MGIMTIKAKKITLNIITILLIIVFIVAGFGKLMRTEMVVDNFERYDIPIGLMLLLGFLELSAAIGLLIPKVRLFAAAGLSVIMAGAIVVHVYHDELDQIAGPAIFFIMLIAFITMRKQLLKLPKPKKR
jgi:uncharacterized membrane protein YphA (DoxX/SURF4 family)